MLKASEVLLIALLVSLLITPAHAADSVVTKAQFVEGIQPGLLEAFCADKAYFRKCFSVTKDECAKTTKAATKACLDKMQADFPAQFHQPADGGKWGEKLGQCAGNKFEEEFAKKKLKSADCEDASKWK